MPKRNIPEPGEKRRVACHVFGKGLGALRTFNPEGLPRDYKHVVIPFALPPDNPLLSRVSWVAILDSLLQAELLCLRVGGPYDRARP